MLRSWGLTEKDGEVDLEPEREVSVRAREVLVGDGEGHRFVWVWPAQQGCEDHLPEQVHRTGSGPISSISTCCFSIPDLGYGAGDP